MQEELKSLLDPTSGLLSAKRSRGERAKFTLVADAIIRIYAFLRLHRGRRGARAEEEVDERQDSIGSRDPVKEEIRLRRDEERENAREWKRRRTDGRKRASCDVPRRRRNTLEVRALICNRLHMRAMAGEQYDHR